MPSSFDGAILARQARFFKSAARHHIWPLRTRDPGGQIFLRAAPGAPPYLAAPSTFRYFRHLIVCH
jgi:hypothetical protein